MLVQSRVSQGYFIIGLFIVVAFGCDGRMPPFEPLLPSTDAGTPADSPASEPDVARVECENNDDCVGFCVGGSCCVTAERVCGNTCCGAGERCFANACVRPGRDCNAAADCEDGEYCEPAFGTNNTGGNVVAPPDGANCTQPLPNAGRCLSLPPRCAVGQDPVKNECLPECEVRPQLGVVDAVKQWTWGASNVARFKDHVDVWSTPVVGRVTDSNCDGKVDRLDPPNIIFVAGNAEGTCCQCIKGEVSACHSGVLRVLDGASGKEIWSLKRAYLQSKGFMGVSLAIADLNRDGFMEIAAITGEGNLVILDHNGKPLMRSEKRFPGSVSRGFGWGGGLAVADMNGDGAPEIAYGSTVFTTQNGKLTFLFTGEHGVGGGANQALSLFADVDGDGAQELVTGNAVYEYDGSVSWAEPSRQDGFTAVGDFNGDGRPEVVVISTGNATIVSGEHGAIVAGPLKLPGAGKGGPPTVADFDGDGRAEIGVAKDLYYAVLDVDFEKPVEQRLSVLWKQANHDLSSSVTGSTVFDFEGDGRAEVIYNDECFLWVYDGKTGDVLFATPTTSFTATEASLVADVDGDGRAEMVMIANRASPKGWRCTEAPWNKPDPLLNRPAWVPPKGAAAYSGITVWADRQDSWVGTRTLWNQHTYHVSNICDERDGVCGPGENQYGVVPRRESANWKVPWLNNYRQNVQDKGLFDAADAAISLRVDCRAPLTLRASVKNLGRALLPAGIEVGLYHVQGSKRRLMATLKTQGPLFPGQAMELPFSPGAQSGVGDSDHFVAVVEPVQTARFRECRTSNNVSAEVSNPCVIK